MSNMTRELYNTMAEGDQDVQLDVLRDMLAQQEAADSKKNELQNSIQKINQGTSGGGSQIAGTRRKKNQS